MGNREPSSKIGWMVSVNPPSERGFKRCRLGRCSMTRAHASGGGKDMMSPEDINEGAEVLGKQIWRVVPYAKKYPGRVFTGIFANAAARFFDLMPFVAIGLAVDYFTTDVLSGPQIVQ